MANDIRMVTDYRTQQRNPRKHMVGLSVVVGLHAVLLYAVTTGLANQMIVKVAKPVSA